MNIVKPGGHIFVGDVRSLPLLPLFASSVELFQAPDDLSIGELRERIRKRIETEQQLVLSPAYFLSLQGLFPKVSSIEIQPRWGRIDNEMSVYRYDAILHVGDRESPATPIDFKDQPDLRVLLSWAASREDGSYDAAFLPPATIGDIPGVRVNWPKPEAVQFVNVANAPGQSKIRTELVDQLSSHCRKELEEQMLPRDFVFVDTLPKMESAATGMTS